MEGAVAMTRATATEVKTRFGEYLEKARHEPVMVEKTGREYVVLLSAEEYERLQALEDAYWIAKADQAAKSGFVGTEKAMSVLTHVPRED
jgi:prevent-host-death family protein